MGQELHFLDVFISLTVFFKVLGKYFKDFLCYICKKQTTVAENGNVKTNTVLQSEI